MIVDPMYGSTIIGSVSERCSFLKSVRLHGGEWKCKCYDALKRNRWKSVFISHPDISKEDISFELLNEIYFIDAGSNWNNSSEEFKKVE